MKRYILILFLIGLIAGCAAPLSRNTCNSLQAVSMKIMMDRQAGLSKGEAVAKLERFASGKPDARPFTEVAARIIESAYSQPLGTTESEKSEIVAAFVSSMDADCLSGKLDPSYNPIIRTAPAVLH